jgi:hypothetical protein
VLLIFRVVRDDAHAKAGSFAVRPGLMPVLRNTIFTEGYIRKYINQMRIDYVKAEHWEPESQTYRRQ